MERKNLNYWSSKGLFQHLVEPLQAKLPASGACSKPRSANKALDKFRRAGNAYYDIFNNGGCNRAGQIRNVFGISMSNYTFGGRHRGYRTNFDRIFNDIEPIMDGIILDAAFEQGLLLSTEYRESKKVVECLSQFSPAVLARVAAALSAATLADIQEEEREAKRREEKKAA